MADTGAPHFIPYVEPTDLVRDYPAADEASAFAVAAGLSAAGNAGIGSNVVQTVKTDTFTTSSTAFTTVTGLSATITPSSDTSKILLIAQISVSLGNNTGVGHFRFAGGNTSTYVGDPGLSDQVRAVFGGFVNTNVNQFMGSYSLVFLDSPATTGATTYTVEARQALDGSVFVNRTKGNSNQEANGRGASTLTVIEVAA